MPPISRFPGIMAAMFDGGHRPPRFDARYGDDEHDVFPAHYKRGHRIEVVFDDGRRELCAGVGN